FQSEVETGPPPGFDLDIGVDRQTLGVNEPDAAPARLYRIGGEPPLGVRHPDFLPVKLDTGARHVALDLQTPSKLPLEFDCYYEFFLRFERERFLRVPVMLGLDLDPVFSGGQLL